MFLLCFSLSLAVSVRLSITVIKDHDQFLLSNLALLPSSPLSLLSPFPSPCTHGRLVVLSPPFSFFAFFSFYFPSPKVIWEEGFISAKNSQFLLWHWWTGTQAGSEAGAMEELFCYCVSAAYLVLHDSLHLLSYTPQDHLSRNGAIHCGQRSLSINQENALQTSYSQHEGIFSLPT